MESGAEPKEGRGSDQGMIASRMKKENTTIGLVGSKPKINMERKCAIQERREADQ